MKTLKRMMSGALAVLLLVCLMAVPASAATESGEFSITINSPHGGHTYEAYQIFKGSLSGNVLSNIQWGSGITSAGQTELQTAYGKSDATGVAGTLNDGNVADFADKAAGYLNSSEVYTSETWDESNNKYVISNVPAGYYLVRETGNLDGSAHAYTEYVIRIVNNVQFTPKSGVPTLTKEVKLGETGTYKEAISASVGDEVYFRLTASLHTYVRDYKTYFFQFADTLPAGLTYESATVSVLSGATSKSLKSTDYSIDTSGNPITVTIPDVHTAIYNASNAATVISDKIVVEIKTTANSDLVVGQTGNENSAVLHFSNDPNNTTMNNETKMPNQYGTTAKAKAMVYSYQIKVLKVDSANAALVLPNAEFIVGYKDGAGKLTWFNFDNDGKFDGTTTANADSAERLKTDNSGMLTVSGLASGTYHLREVVAPAQYNTLSSDVVVQFVGTLDQNDGTLKDITIESVTGASNYSKDVPNCMINLTITNIKGATLPETGGMGTTIFYVMGIVLVAGAATVLFAKKRTGRN